MSESKHTKGPWHWEYSDGLRKRLTTVGSDVFTAALTDDYFPYVDIDEPDANLIAAAPELLEALEFALQQTGCDGDLCTEDWHEEARKAIAKAKGEA